MGEDSACPAAARFAASSRSTPGTAATAAHTIARRVSRAPHASDATTAATGTAAIGCVAASSPTASPAAAEDARVVRAPRVQGQREPRRHGHRRRPVREHLGGRVAQRRGQHRQPGRHAGDPLGLRCPHGGRERDLARQRVRRQGERRREQRPDEHGRAHEERRREQERIPGRKDAARPVGRREEQVAHAEARGRIGQRPRERAVRQRPALQPVRRGDRRPRSAVQVVRHVPERQERGHEARDREEASTARQVRDAGEVEHRAEPARSARQEGEQHEGKRPRRARSAPGDRSAAPRFRAT